MTLKNNKKEAMKLLEAGEEKEAIKKLNGWFKDDELKKEFESLDYKTCVVDKLQDEEFIPIENKNYLVSNFGRIKLNDGKNPVIPQCQDDKWDWYLNIKKFKENHPEFKDKILSETTRVYEFIKETKWLEEEKEKIQKIYPNCKLELHHINRWGDNRIDNMIYLPVNIHNEVHKSDN